MFTHISKWESLDGTKLTGRPNPASLHAVQWNYSHSTGQNLLGGKTLQVNTLYSEHVYLTERRGFLVTVELYCDHFHYVLTYVDETLPVRFIVTINMCDTVVWTWLTHSFLQPTHYFNASIDCSLSNTFPVHTRVLQPPFLLLVVALRHVLGLKL